MSTIFFVVNDTTVAMPSCLTFKPCMSGYIILVGKSPVVASKSSHLYPCVVDEAIKELWWKRWRPLPRWSSL